MQAGRWLARSEELLERHAAFAAAALLSVFAGAALYASRRQALWFDELFTYYISSLPLGGIWPALANGVDIHAPLDYWLRHLAMSVLGSGELAFRLPSVAAATAAGWLVFAITRSFSSGIAGVAATALFTAFPVFQYAHKGRNYALMIAFTALAIFGWQRVRRNESLGLVALAVGLAGGVLSHYYSVLAFFPIAAGELVHSILHRGIRWRVWAAMLAGGLPLLFLLPLMRTASHVAEGFDATSSLMGILMAYRELGPGSVEPLLLIGIAASLFGLRVRPVRDPALAILLIGVALLPFAVYALAAAFTGRLFSRYSLPFVIGSSILLGHVLAGFRWRRWRVSPLIAMGAMLLSAASWLVHVRSKPGVSALQQEIAQLQRITSGDLAPIVFLDQEVSAAPTLRPRGFPQTARGTRFSSGHRSRPALRRPRHVANPRSAGVRRASRLLAHRERQLHAAPHPRGKGRGRRILERPAGFSRREPGRVRLLR